MGQRERARRRTPEERNAEARAALDPLKPGERPAAVTVAAVVAAVMGLGNVALYVAGYDVRGEDPSAAGALGLSAVMLLAAAGMWKARYWAVLGFQSLLAVTAVFAGLSLMVAGNLEAVLRSLAVMLGAGTLFWFLVRAMARLQMPRRPSGE